MDTENHGIEELFDKFAEALRYEQGRSPHTVRAYTRDVLEYARYIAGDAERFDPGSISTSDVRVWLADMSRRGLQQTTVKRKLESLRSFFIYLIRAGEITSDPTAPIELSVRKKPLPKYVPAREMEKLLSDDAAADDAGSFPALRDRMIVTLLYTTGMRRAEILALHDSDFRTGRRELRILGKGNKERVVPLAPEIIALAEQYISARNEKFPAGRGDRFLVGDRGRNMSERALSDTVRRQLSATGASQKTPHVLRHTFATAMLNGGADINTVKEFLGHSSLATTQIYTHVSYAEMRRDYDRAHPRAAEEAATETDKEENT